MYRYQHHRRVSDNRQYRCKTLIFGKLYFLVILYRLIVIFYSISSCPPHNLAVYSSCRPQFIHERACLSSSQMNCSTSFEHRKCDPIWRRSVQILTPSQMSHKFAPTIKPPLGPCSTEVHSLVCISCRPRVFGKNLPTFV